MLLAMGRRGDMPSAVARLNQAGTTPTVAVIVIGVVIGGLVLIGDVFITWSLSAFTVLIYYAITNMSALRLKPQERLFPRFIAWVGLGACLFLAFWVEIQIWLVGLGLIMVGLLWHIISMRLFGQPANQK
jgi:APA family basic amino acid/polyamine antiporter